MTTADSHATEPAEQPGRGSSAQRRILIATFGSLGDLHPFLALALELRRRGHQVTVATAATYAERVAELDLAFQAIGPAISPDDTALIHRLMRTARGPEYLFRRVFLPQLPELYAQLHRLSADADLLVASEVVFAAPILAETTGLRWVSVLLSPIAFLSAHDPSAPPVERPPWWYGMPTPVHRLLLRGLAAATRHWAAPVQALRQSLGLRPAPDALLRGKLSAPLVLAMFSRHFAAAQPDWPAQTVQTGFAFFDQSAFRAQEDEHTERLKAFLAGGTRPVVFTLGSSAVHAAEDFFHVSAGAAHRLRIRAVLISPRADVQMLAAPNILVVPYADYRVLFPQAAAVVHQGGVGTTAETLRAGVPALVVPFNFDQPDNAARAVRLGVAVTLPRRKYNRRHSYYALHRLLRDPSLCERAAALGERIRAEDGTGCAADAVERILDRREREA